MPITLAVGDVSTFRKYVKNIGRPYQKRSVVMIQLCRLFLEISSGKPDQSDALLFETVEDALKSAVEAGKGRSEVADEAFFTAEERLAQYTWRYHSNEQTVIGDVHDIIEDAAQKDTQIMKIYNRSSSRLGFDRTETPRSLVKVRFQILHSPTDRANAPIVTRELGPEVTVSELLWIFSRLPEDQRVTLKQNPHFYLSKDLSDQPLSYGDDFVLKPLKGLKPEKDLLVLILLDRPGQIYFDYEKFSKTYGNIWRPHNTIILKDPQGTLEAANRISSKINGEVCIWQRGGDRHAEDLTEWTTVLDEALGAPETDWLIRSETSIDEALDIELKGGWERRSPIPVPEPPVFGDHTANISVEEVQIDVECFLPAEDAVSMVPEVPSPLDSDVQLETAVPSPASTPQVLPELLDPPIGSALDATSNMFTPEIITTTKTHLLVEVVHVPFEHTPPSALPTPPVSDDEAVASDGDPTTPLSETIHPQLQLVRSPPQTLPSHAPPMQASNVLTPNIPARPVEPVHLPARPVLSPPNFVTRPPESKPAVKSEVTTSRERTFASNPPAQHVVEDVSSPVQPVPTRPGPQVLAPPVIKPVPSSSATDDSNFSASSIGNGPLFPIPTSDPAKETVFNTYEAFLPVRKAGGDGIRLLDKHGTSLQLALPIPDTSLQFPVSPVEPTPVPFPVPYLNPNPSTSSIGSSLFLIPNGSLESLANASEPHPL